MSAAPARAPGAPALSSLRAVGALLARIPRALGIVPLLLWLALIEHFSSLPATDRPPSPWGSFKNNFGHAVVYGLLALWAALLLPRERGWPRIDRRGALAILGFVLAVGWIDEWNQSRMPGRDSSWTDVLTDVVGAAAVLAVAAYAGRSDATERGLRLRLCLAALACSLSALNATFGG